MIIIHILDLGLKNLIKFETNTINKYLFYNSKFNKMN